MHFQTGVLLGSGANRFPISIVSVGCLSFEFFIWLSHLLSVAYDVASPTAPQSTAHAALGKGNREE
jgi:hypothetical protein